MIISNKHQLVTFKGAGAVNIRDLPNISNVESIFAYSSSTITATRWKFTDPDDLQGFLSLTNKQGYSITSAKTASYPYTLYSGTEAPLLSKFMATEASLFFTV